MHAGGLLARCVRNPWLGIADVGMILGNWDAILSGSLMTDVTRILSAIENGYARPSVLLAGSKSASIPCPSNGSGGGLLVKFACVSVSTASTLFPRSRHTPASNHTVCVLPTPPLRLMMVRTGAWEMGDWDMREW